jgi:ATP-dependent Clp protease, protease subunit
MGTQPVSPITVPAEIYGIFAGLVDLAAVQKFSQAIDLSSKGTASGLKHVHLAFQCQGGGIGEGIALYNLFRTLPFELALYNIGTVASIGVVAYLGAKIRRISAHGAFMMHRTQTTTQAANTQTVKSFADAAILADQRTEAILREHVTMPDEKWAHFNHNDLWLSAEEAVKFGLAHEVAEFAPPVGTQLFSL